MIREKQLQEIIETNTNVNMNSTWVNIVQPLTIHKVKTFNIDSKGHCFDAAPDLLSWKEA